MAQRRSRGRYPPRHSVDRRVYLSDSSASRQTDLTGSKVDQMLFVIGNALPSFRADPVIRLRMHANHLHRFGGHLRKTKGPARAAQGSTGKSRATARHYRGRSSLPYILRISKLELLQMQSMYLVSWQSYPANVLNRTRVPYLLY